MPSRYDEDDMIQLPSDPDYITLPTDRRKCGAERVSFSGEGSISVHPPVMQIFEAGTGSGAERSVRIPFNGHHTSSCSSISNF
jgi:hypothetical protein